MPYMGEVSAGKEISARLELDGQAAGPAHLFIAAAASGQPPISDGDVASPAGFARVVVTPIAKGRLEIVVDMSSDADTGRLVVSQNGTVINDQKVTGDTAWAYSVLKS